MVSTMAHDERNTVRIPVCLDMIQTDTDRVAIHPTSSSEMP